MWTTLFKSLRSGHVFLQGRYLESLAKAGNVEALAAIMTQTEIEQSEMEKQDKKGNTFLHTFAQKHNLNNLFRKIRIALTKDVKIGKRNKIEKKVNWLDKCLAMHNNEGYTFLAVAILNVNNEHSVYNSKYKKLEKDLVDAFDHMTNIFEDTFLPMFCKKKDNGGNSLFHLAVQKSLPELMSFFLMKTKNSHEIFNQDGYNPLHLAVQTNNIKMVKLISQDKIFDVNVKMQNGETALHIVAQLGHSNMLGDLIQHRGDLSVKDNEEGHTPLHDCLQQVYFEGGNTEEKCEKFIRVWKKVVEAAVTWWCLKQHQSEPAKGSNEYLKMQQKAVYYLRSCIKNSNGLSVLQFAADRGLVTCVQTMLSTKDVFATQTEIQTKQGKEGTKELEPITEHEIDVTNLCPEYFAEESILYSKEELRKLETNDCAQRSTVSNFMQEENGSATNAEEITSFLDSLAQVTPPNKAGEILESIPMRSLTMLEWRVSQWIHIVWMIIHLVLMIMATIEVTKSDSEPSVSWIILGTFILICSTVMTILHLTVTIIRCQPNKNHARRSVQESIKQYEREKGNAGKFSWILSIPLMIFNQAILLLELSFTAFAWAVFVPTNLNTTDYPWVAGFFLLFGWLMFLIPMTSYSPIYKLISVLKYIVIRDMFPWILIYVTISIGFSTAIKLQFQQIPGNSTCIGDEPYLTGFLQETGHTLYELLIVTSGLDTDLKNVRNLECLFKSNSKSAHAMLILITLYAVISAVVLLNMLIAIMSNTVTLAQMDKGWRQYQVSSIHFQLINRYLANFTLQCLVHQIHAILEFFMINNLAVSARFGRSKSKLYVCMFVDTWYLKRHVYFRTNLLPLLVFIIILCVKKITIYICQIPYRD